MPMLPSRLAMSPRRLHPQARRSPRRRTSPRRAWAGDPPTLHAAARERLLDAAVRCVAREGMVGANVAAVAAEAGVSRPTVYRYFVDRQALVEATFLHAARDLSERLGARLRRLAAPAEMAVEAVCFVLREIPREPVLGAMWSEAVIDASAVAIITRRPALDWSRNAVKDLVRAAGWSAAAAAEAVEVMLRMLLSLLAAPEPRRSDAALRAFLMRRLVPALGLATPARSSSR
jgi:AcrR family transcriptional regulator